MFDEINYLDLIDSKPKERRICSGLKEGICKVRKTFSVGNII